MMLPLSVKLDRRREVVVKLRMHTGEADCTIRPLSSNAAVRPLAHRPPRERIARGRLHPHEFGGGLVLDRIQRRVADDQQALAARGLHCDRRRSADVPGLVGHHALPGRLRLIHHGVHQPRHPVQRQEPGRHLGRQNCVRRLGYDLCALHLRRRCTHRQSMLRVAQGEILLQRFRLPEHNV